MSDLSNSDIIIALLYLDDMDKHHTCNEYKIIKQSLEKQMPKKLVSIRKIKEFDGYDMGNCPTCGEPLDNSFYENLKYCFVCGQAIDWGEENE
jgi:hypothetical protein